MRRVAAHSMVRVNSNRSKMETPERFVRPGVASLFPLVY